MAKAEKEHKMTKTIIRTVKLIAIAISEAIQTTRDILMRWFRPTKLDKISRKVTNVVYNVRKATREKAESVSIIINESHVAIKTATGKWVIKPIKEIIKKIISLIVKQAEQAKKLGQKVINFVAEQVKKFGDVVKNIYYKIKNIWSNPELVSAKA